jgi:tetratricopeptide (TPR) repeat protein
VLLLEPGHPAAMSMRAQLAPAAHVAAYPAASADPFSEIGANVPLASYDVESGGVDEVLHRTGPHGHGDHALDGGGTLAMEDFEAEGFGAPPMASRRGGHMAVALPSALAGLDERALEEADLLAELGQYGEARAILLVQLQSNPNHPLIMDRLTELDSLAAAQQAAAVPEAQPSVQGGYYQQDPRQSWAAIDPQYATGGYPAAHPQQQSMAPESDPYAQAGYAPTSGAYQTGHAAAMHPGDAYPPAPHPYDPQTYDPQAAYGQQAAYSPYDTGQYAQVPAPADPVPAVPAATPQGAGIRHEVAEGDNQTHYDLGVAYMEMGMASQAVSELTLAARDPGRECVCMSMIGTIHLQTGEIDAGLDALTRALNAPHKTREQELALGYEIANTYEAKGMVEQALYYFEWLTQIDASYEDMRGSVGDRIRRLRAGSGPQPVPGAAQGYPVPGAGHGQR